VAVCVSVTLMYCALTTEAIVVRPSLDCSLAILVFTYKYEPDSLRGYPILRASNVGKTMVAWRPLANTFVHASDRQVAIPTCF